MSINATRLKTIAVIAMIIDHIAWTFFPLSSTSSQIMHGVGRLTFPIMAFMVAEGFYHTRSYKKYLNRMGVFAIISHFPYQYFTFGRIPIFQPLPNDGLYEWLASSVIFTFYISLIVLKIYNTHHIGIHIKTIILTLLTLLTIFSDYAIFGPLLVLIYHSNRGDRRLQLIGSSLFMILYIGLSFQKPYFQSMYTLGILLANFLLFFYNNEQGKSKYKFIQYSYYIIYPLHLLILGFYK